MNLLFVVLRLRRRDNYRVAGERGRGRAGTAAGIGYDGRFQVGWSIAAVARWTGGASWRASRTINRGIAYGIRFHTFFAAEPAAKETILGQTVRTTRRNGNRCHYER